MLVCDQERENYLFLVPSLITIYRIQKKDYSLEGKCFRFLIKNETLKMFPTLLFSTSFWNKITTNVLRNLVLDTLFQKHKKRYIENLVKFIIPLMNILFPFILFSCIYLFYFTNNFEDRFRSFKILQQMLPFFLSAFSHFMKYELKVYDPTRSVKILKRQ